MNSTSFSGKTIFTGFDFSKLNSSVTLIDTRGLVFGGWGAKSEIYISEKNNVGSLKRKFFNQFIERCVDFFKKYYKQSITR